MTKPLVSVVIPTYNEEQDIRECLDTLKKQNYNPIEVIVVDDGSIDKTLDIIKEFESVKLLRQKLQLSWQCIVKKTARYLYFFGSFIFIFMVEHNPN